MSTIQRAACGVRRTGLVASAAGRLIALVLMTSLATATELDQQFSDANADPTAVVPLILAVSTTLPSLPADAAVALGDRVAPFCHRLFTETLPGRADCGLITHVIAAGETPSALAKRYHTSVELIQRLNPGLDAKTLAIGQELTVLDLAATPLELVVSRSAYRLMAWRGPVLLAALRCGLGRDSSPTPLGVTTVRQCVRNPDWRNPDTGKILKPDDPENILGGYWIGFEPRADQQFKGIGIHGFTGADPTQWLEKNGSHGCVRLVQEDIALVFALVRPGITVTVRE